MQGVEPLALGLVLVHYLLMSQTVNKSSQTVYYPQGLVYLLSLGMIYTLFELFEHL